MSLHHRVLAKIAEMRGVSAGSPVNDVIALAWLDDISTKVVQLFNQARVVPALLGDREVLRQTLTALAFDYGLRDGHLEDLLLLEWPVDPEPPKPEDKPKVEVVRPKLVSLH